MDLWAMFGFNVDFSSGNPYKLVKTRFAADFHWETGSRTSAGFVLENDQCIFFLDSNGISAAASRPQNALVNCCEFPLQKNGRTVRWLDLNTEVMQTLLIIIVGLVPCWLSFLAWCLAMCSHVFFVSVGTKLSSTTWGVDRPCLLPSWQEISTCRSSTETIILYNSHFCNAVRPRL